MSQALVDAVRDLARAYQAALLYPEGHPAVRSTVAESWGGLHGVLQKEGSLVLRIGGDQVMIAGRDEPLEAGPALQSLISTLHELDVSSIELKPGIPEEELVRFVDALIQARREDAMGHELLRELTGSGLPHLHLEFIDYAALSFQEGAKEEGEEGQYGDVWLGLLQTVSSADPDTPAPEPEDYARKVTKVIAMREGTGIGELRDVIRRAHVESQTVGVEQMDVTRGKVLRFLGALTPTLRSDLLRIDPQSPQQMLGLVTDLAEDLQLPDLLESLDGLEQVGHAVPSNLIPLLAKLVRMSEGGDERGQAIRERMEEWGLSSVPTNLKKEELNQALSEVLNKRGDLNPNPEVYGQMLEGLVRGRLEGVGGASSAEIYGDPGELHGLRLQALEIALRSLHNELTDLSAGPLARLSVDSGLLIELGRLESLRETAATAVEISRQKDVSEPLQLASRGFLETFRMRQTIDAIIENATSLGGMSGSALYLLGLGGREAARAVIEALENDVESPLSLDLLEFLESVGTTVLVAVVRERIAEDEKRLQAMARYLRRLGADKAIPAFEALFEHPSPPVRRRALVELCEKAKDPKLLKVYLSQGLQDQDRLVAEQAFRILLTLDSRDINELLLEILTNVIEGRERSTYWAVPLATRLVRGGSTKGLERLVSLIGDLQWSWRARHGRLALALSRVLEPFAGRPDIARILRHIKYSPAGLFARVKYAVKQRQKDETR